MNEPERAPLRMAVCALAISHFEVPMFRLAANLPGLDLRVFYILEVPKAQRFDAEYGQLIHWGDDLLAGYASQRCTDASAMHKEVEAWGADVVLMYGYSWRGAARMILSRWLRGKPQIHRGTLNYHHDPRARWRSRLLRPIGRWLLGRFDAHHFGGKYSRKVLLDAGAREDSLFFEPYSVDSKWFEAQSESTEQIAAARRLRETCGWTPDDRVLLFICQHSWFKGPDIALEVFRRYHETDESARLLVAGSGVKTEEMKRFVQQHGLADSVHFAGFVPSLETVPYYLASDLVLCTSRYETWARMINEAMLCGKPCIASELVPASGDLVLDGVTGYVTQSLDSEAFVSAIRRHFSLQPATRDVMAKTARQTALEFSYERHIDNVLAAARYAVERRRS